MSAGSCFRDAFAQEQQRMRQAKSPMPSERHDASHPAADGRERGRDRRSIAELLKQVRSTSQQTVGWMEKPWWRAEALQPISSTARGIPTSFDDLIQLALINSARLKIAKLLHRIRRTAVTEADAEFDWKFP